MTYAISDIHGCYDEFMALLEQIQFNPANDTLYVLGDAVDRGSNSIDCLTFMMETDNVHFIIGNHEQMMLDYYNGEDDMGDWDRNGNELTKAHLGELHPDICAELFVYLRKCPYYAAVEVNRQRYFLSHAGLDASVPLEQQPQDALIWSREEFYKHKALDDYICVFGHTPTPYLHGTADYSVWHDKKHSDKICIDCACVFGGALAALRLDDGEIFYVKSNNK